jgi:multisubunit Na+/H+ antiporter MnhB subunit
VKSPERKDLSWTDRLAFAVVGFFMVAYGYWQVLRGKWIYTNWRGLDVPAYFVVILGALFLLAAVFPWGWIHFLWATNRKKRRY